MTHSLGPWTVERNTATQATWNVFDATGIRIAEVLAGPSRLKRGYLGQTVFEADDPIDGPHNAATIGAAAEMLAELRKAESFIAGFEDDELQEGIPDLLAGIRAAIAKASA